MDEIGVCHRRVAVQAGQASHGFRGRGYSVLGDSISTLAGFIPDGWRVHYEGEVHALGITSPEDTWWGKVIGHFGGRLVANASYSGSVVEGFGFPAAVSPERISALIGADGCIPDVVLVYMGINDYGWGGGRNQVMGGSLSASASPEDLEGPRGVEPVVDGEALARFSNAYCKVLESISDIVPDADIWCLTLAPATSPDPERQCYKYQIRGIELDSYNDAIRDAARLAGANVADVRSYGIAYDALDGCHPSALGMSQIADMVIDQMEGGGGEVPPSIARGVPASRSCGRGHCAGCPMDESTSGHWTIVCPGPIE